MRDKFIISGGGIGGLATALALSLAGKKSIVLEQAAEFNEIGAGIQLAPNAFHCLDLLGVGEAARSIAIYIDQLRLMDATDAKEICNIPLKEDFRKWFKNPYAVIHRADLHGILLKACRASNLIELRAYHHVIGYSKEDAGVSVQVKNSDNVCGRALVAADGLHSVVRNTMLGDGVPRISGHTTYRSVIPVERMPKNSRWNAAALWAGPKCHIVHYPLKGWKYFNLVVTFHDDAQRVVSGESVSAEQVTRGFDHIAEEPFNIVRQGIDWRLWVLCDRDPVTRWTDGPVVLLGDAAHPMLQYFAQGACMAMEDAVCLGMMVKSFDKPSEAFNQYLDRRMVRTSRVSMYSRLIGDHIYHPSGAQAAVRNSVMSALSPEDWYRKLNWIYGPQSFG